VPHAGQPEQSYWAFAGGALPDAGANFQLIITLSRMRLQSKGADCLDVSIAIAQAQISFVGTESTRGATRVSPLGLLLHSGQDNPQTSGLKVVATRPHQAHPNHMARATADVLSNNRIIML
jgi:hypothetical protein